MVVVLGAIVLGTWCASTATAALDEREEREQIDRGAKVVRYLYSKVADMEQKMGAIARLRTLTEHQREAQKKLIEEEKRKKQPSQIKLAWYQMTLDKLERQLKRINKADLEKLYAARIAEVKKQIVKHGDELEANVTEFRVHFGKEPRVDLRLGAKAGGTSARRRYVSVRR